MKQRPSLTICFFGTYDPGFSSNKIVRDGLRANGVTIHEVNAYIPLTRMDRKGDMGLIPMAKRILKKGKIIGEVYRQFSNIRASDVIFVGYPGHIDIIPAWIIARLLGKKLVFYPLLILYTIFIDDFSLVGATSLKARIMKKGEQMIYWLCDLVLADTPQQKRYLMQEFSIPDLRIALLPVGADDTIYTPTTKRHTNTRSFNVVYYGMYTPLHGIEHIIESARLTQKDPAIRYSMVGKGVTYEEQYKRAQELGLKNIVFYPDMTEKNARATLASADVFLGFLQKHPTVDRVIPNKVYQGLALGKAVVTADTPVVREYFTHKKNIFVCEAGNGKSLAAAIRTLKNDRKLTQSIADEGYLLFQNQFTPRVLGKQFTSIIAKHFFT